MKQNMRNKMSIRNIGVRVYMCVCGSEGVRGSAQQQLSMQTDFGAKSSNIAVKDV
jgi:hypothetical protein